MQNIPDSSAKRVVIIGGGFAGLKLAKAIDRKHFQVVLIDKGNYHQFQPLMYQVATAGLEPSGISFPFRKALQDEENTHFRMAELQSVDIENKEITTDTGKLKYHYLVIATGADTNFFGMENIQKNAMPMKSVAEALAIRNTLIQNLEEAVNTQDKTKQNALLNVAIVGGGPTGVELAGAVSEMKRHVLPKDYPEIDFGAMQIHLFESSPEVLEVMSEKSSTKAKKYLTDMGVQVHNGVRVTDYDGNTISTMTGQTFEAKMLIWAAGIKTHKINGLPDSVYGRGGRMTVDRFNRVIGVNDVFAVGDCALMVEGEKFPNGHPQVAPAAIQQATLLAKNINCWEAGKQPSEYVYYDKGSMATVGRNKAVVDAPFMHFSGFFAWAAWLFVHLMYILGVKNKLFILLNWIYSYFTYDQSLRLIIKPKNK